MRRFIVVAFALFVAIVFGRSGYDVQYQRINSSETQITFSTSDYFISVVEKGGVMYSQINDAGSVFTNEKGFAEIPYHAAAVQLKDDKNVTMKYSAESFKDIVLEYPLLPSRGVISRSQNIDEIPYEISKSSEQNVSYPGKVTEMTDPFIMRDVRGTHILVYPYQYNAATRTLRVYKTINVSLIENNDEVINPLTVKPEKVVSEMSGMYESIFLNYNETKALSIGSQGEILVVYTSQNGGLTALQPWIDWKRQKGFKVNLLEKANGTDLYVTQDIKNAYLANTNILYAQIVGDFPNLKSQILNSVTSTTGSQDPMLGCTVGTDQYIDVVVGRFSVSSEAELTTQINKSIAYEKTPTFAATWYEKGIGIASNEGAGAGDDGEGDQAHMDIIIANKLIPFTYASVDKAYQANNVTKSTILGYVNNGRSLINYAGHGNYDCWQSIYGGYLYNTDVNSLTNGTMLPFVLSVACLVGNIEYSSVCFGETWVRKSGGGAVAGWFSTISQPWLPPMKGQDYFNDILKGGYDYSTQPGDGTNVTEQRTTVGTICANASNLMLAEAPTDAATKDTQESWTILGDVSLQLRTDPPKQITNSNATINTGSYATTVTATTGGAAVAGAIVTLYKGGVNYTGLTNSSGSLTLSHGFASGDAVTLTVSGFNLETEQSTITVGGTATVPAVPTLAAPSNASSTTDLTPTFDWNDVSGATSYTILADNNSDFTSNEINQTVTSSTYTPGTNLAAGTYYWKVKATNATGSSAYTSAWTVVLQTVTAVTLPVAADFTVAALPSGWTNADNQGGGQVWQFGTHASGMTTSGNYAYLNSDAYGSGKTQNADLITPLINCTGATNVTLAFSHYFKSYTGSSATLSYSVNGGSTWTVIQSWTVTTTNPVSFSQVITAVAGQAQVKFKWNYTGTYGYYWDVDNISITSGTTPTVPSVPTLATPANASSTTDLTPTFDWNDVSGATSYTILVDNNSDFLSNEINQVPTASTYTPSANLAVGTYYWKVRATNANGSSAYTSAWTVTLTAAPTVPSVPTLATPANASSTTDLTPTFDWNDVSGATSYTILVDNNSDFLSNEINQVPTASTYTPAANLAAGTYYWKVKATNAAGSSAYTSAWTVVVQSTGGVPLPFSENFATSSIPADWSQVNTSGVTNRWTASNTNNAGGAAYEMKATYQQINPGTARFVTPPVNTTGCSSLNFSFRHMLDAYAAGVTLRIQSSTDKINWTNESWSVATSSSNIPAAVVNTTVNNNLGNITYIAFVFTGDLYQIDYWYIDNVSVTSGTAPTIPAVPTLATPSSGSSTTDLTPTFDWNDVSGATSYTIQIDNNSDFSSPTITNSPTASTYTPASNLAAGTYYWRVLATNATGSSAYSSSWSVILSSSSTPVTLLTTNFPSTTLPTGWSIVDNVGAGQVWKIGTHTSGLGGTPGNYAYLNSDAFGSGKTQNSDIITPVINCSGKTGITLTFKHYFKAYTGSSAKLYYSINGGSTWTQIQAWTASTANPATFTQVITAVAGQASVKFKWNYTGTWGYYWDVDDISVTGTNSKELLESPSNIITRVKGSEFVMEWDIVGGAERYDVYSSDSPDGKFTLETSVTGTIFTAPYSSERRFYYVVAVNSDDILSR